MLSKYSSSHPLKGRLCVGVCVQVHQLYGPGGFFQKAIIDERHIKTFQRVSLRNDEVRNRRHPLIYSVMSALSTHNRLICFKLLFRWNNGDFLKSYVHVSKPKPRGLKRIVWQNSHPATLSRISKNSKASPPTHPDPSLPSRRWFQRDLISQAKLHEHRRRSSICSTLFILFSHNWFKVRVSSSDVRMRRLELNKLPPKFLMILIPNRPNNKVRRASIPKLSQTPQNNLPSLT